MLYHHHPEAWAPYLAFVHVQGLCPQGQLPLCSTDGALKEALLLFQLAHHLQLGVDLEGRGGSGLGEQESGRGQESGSRYMRRELRVRGVTRYKNICTSPPWF